jgi:hypothetical protein
VSVPEQIGSLKEIKQKVRELEPNVSYIDVKIGQNDFFVRCKNQEDSEKLSKKQVNVILNLSIIILYNLSTYLIFFCPNYLSIYYVF